MARLRTAARPAWPALGALTLLLVGCGGTVEPLMPSPVLYTGAGMVPFPRLSEDQRRPVVDILYATNRGRNDDWRVIEYANIPTERVSLGAAGVRIGGPDMTWDTLEAASTSDKRDEPIALALSGIFERGGFAVADPLAEPDLDSRDFLDTINSRVAASTSGDVFIFVHGAMVDFYNACAFTGQMAHFMGRDMVGIAFAWPTEQNIIAYGTGQDVRRAYESGGALASLIEFLAAGSDARRIHVLSWSAGARVVTEALSSLCERHPDQTPDALRQSFRLGTIYYAAGDVPLAEFLGQIDNVHAVSDRVVVSISGDDEALTMANRFMSGGRRLGQHGEALSAAEREHVDSLERLEVVDVSHGADERGFDISGHMYWFQDPWCSTDTLLVMRTGLPARDRGLQQIDGWRCAWSLPPDYPDRVRGIVDRLRAEAGNGAAPGP